MVPYMYQDLSRLLKKLMWLIVKPEVLTKCESMIDLRNIDSVDKKAIMKPKDINIVFVQGIK